MSLIPYYLQYVSEICEGTRKAPAGIVLTEQEDLKKALQLQAEITKLGIPAFVKACAEADGTEIPQEEYDSFDPAELNTAIAQLAEASQPQEPAEEAPQEPVRTETRDIFEIFLDSVCLDDALLTYLIDILKRRSEPEFAKLSHAAARTELKLDDFLAWLGNMELLAGEDEQACAAIMDKCLYRLEQEGEMELIAALLSGDETTFKLFRTQRRSWCTCRMQPMNGIAGTIWTAIIPSASFCIIRGSSFPAHKEASHGTHLCHRPPQSRYRFHCFRHGLCRAAKRAGRSGICSRASGAYLR